MKARASWARFVLSPFVVLALALGARPAAGDDITIAKDTIRITVDQSGCYTDWNCDPGDMFWFAGIEFEMNGALPSGSQPWVEFTVPDRPPLRRDGSLEEVWGKENRWKVFCNPEKNDENGFKYQAPLPKGKAKFTIGIRNELMETNAVLYEGEFVHDYVLRNPQDPSTAECFVDDDWKLPIGYLYMSDRGLHVITWYRGRPGGVKTYLFHNGVEVANNEGCGIGSESDFDPTHLMWWEVDCELIGVYGDPEAAANGYEPNYDLSKNPGEYEVKCLAAGKLARVVKFTVNPDGSFDNGIAAANQLGSDRVIVPVQVRMDNPPWNKEAYKTGAYYGHPLTGFTLPE